MTIEHTSDLLEKIDSKALVSTFNEAWQTSFAKWRESCADPRAKDPEIAEAALEFCAESFCKMYLCAFAVQQNVFTKEELNKLAFRKAQNLEMACYENVESLPCEKSHADLKADAIKHICSELNMSEDLFARPLEFSSVMNKKITRFNNSFVGRTYDSRNGPPER